MADQLGGASGNATAADLLTGYTASVASGPITGTIPVITSGNQLNPSTTQVNGPTGYYDSTHEPFVPAEPNLVAGNILSGKSIFGVSGNATPKMMATGSGATPSSGAFTVSGLSFRPRTICAWLQPTSSTYLMGTLFYSEEISPFASYQQGEFARGGTSSGINTSSNAYVSTTTFTINNDGFSMSNTNDGFFNGSNVRWVAYG